MYFFQASVILSTARQCQELIEMEFRCTALFQDNLPTLSLCLDCLLTNSRDMSRLSSSNNHSQDSFRVNPNSSSNSLLSSCRRGLGVLSPSCGAD